MATVAGGLQPPHDLTDDQLLELADRYVRVVDLPDSVEALRRMATEQAYAIAKLCVLLDRLQERVARLERRTQ